VPIILEYNGKSPKISKDAFIACNAVIIGDVEIGPYSSIWYNCVIRGDVNSIRIGSRTNIQDGTIVHVGSQNGPTTIGDGITIGHKAMIHACTLENNSFIGMCATIMDHAVVGNHSMVAAGTLVAGKKIVQKNELWAGIPGKLKRELTKEEIEYIKISEDKYVDLGMEHKNIKPTITQY
jgi:carbonic anhydrase/acetyltransferase-like protein (isoleucine patch superfamily)